MIKVSIAIITRNRAKTLLKCLRSVCFECESSDEIIIVDNASSDETLQSVSGFFKDKNIRYKYVYEKNIGYPFARNRAIKESTGSWLVFIDDDCLASRQWLSEFKKSMVNVRGGENIAAILGRNLPVNMDNSFSISNYFFAYRYLNMGVKRGKLTNYELVDTKNIALNMEFLEKNQIQFDEKNSDFLGAGEDCKLGVDIYNKGGVINYNSSAVVYHRDPTSVAQYFYNFYNKKRNSKKVLSQPTNWPLKKKKLLSDIALFLARLSLPLYKKIIIFLVIITTSVVDRHF